MSFYTPLYVVVGAAVVVDPAVPAQRYVVGVGAAHTEMWCNFQQRQFYIHKTCSYCDLY